jgi:hypothetical protein
MLTKQEKACRCQTNVLNLPLYLAPSLNLIQFNLVLLIETLLISFPQYCCLIPSESRIFILKYLLRIFFSLQLRQTLIVSVVDGYQSSNNYAVNLKYRRYAKTFWHLILPYDKDPDDLLVLANVALALMRSNTFKTFDPIQVNLIQLKKIDCRSCNIKPFYMIFIMKTISLTVWNTRSFISCFNISTNQNRTDSDLANQVGRESIQV